MKISDRNRIVANLRWSRIHEKEKEIIKNNLGKGFLKARLCGFLAGDGSIMIRKDNNGDMHYVLRFFPDHKSLIFPFIESLSGIYGKVPIIKKNYMRQGLICYSKVVVEDLLDNATFGILNWRVPFNILRDRNSKIEWLKAFFDSEGYVGKNYIKIQTVNKKGMKDVKKLLREFNIKSKKYTYHPKNKNWHDVHILVIGPKSERLKFLKTIGFNHELKLFKLQNAQVA